MIEANKTLKYIDTCKIFVANLKELNDDVWSEFYDNYSELILNFAKKRGCSHELAQDVLQETVMALFRYLPKFKYDKNKGKFRSLLFKITESKIVDAFRRNNQMNHLRNSEDFNNSQNVFEEDRKHIAHLWDEAMDEIFLVKAMHIVKEKVNPKTYKCFENVFLKGMSVKDVSEKLKIPPNLVSQHKHKVFTMIVDIAKKILEDKR